jgi:uncharacterized membrane protein YhiD involved in acid resistance
MNWIKEKLQWLKEKWWIPVSAAAGTVFVVLLTLLRPRNTKMKMVNANRQLEKDVEDVELEALREENRKKKEALERAGVRVQNLNDEKKRKELEMLEDRKRRKQELAVKSNKELADLLKKDNEI